MTNTKIDLMEVMVLYAKARHIATIIQEHDPSHITRKFPKCHELFGDIILGDRASFECHDILDFIHAADEFICKIGKQVELALTEKV
jgi:hypothetical protein